MGQGRMGGELLGKGPSPLCYSLPHGWGFSLTVLLPLMAGRQGQALP